MSRLLSTMSGCVWGSNSKPWNRETVREMSGIEEIQERVNDALAFAHHMADEMDFDGHTDTPRASRAVGYLKLTSMVLKHPRLMGVNGLAGHIEQHPDSGTAEPSEVLQTVYTELRELIKNMSLFAGTKYAIHQ